MLNKNECVLHIRFLNNNLGGKSNYIKLTSKLTGNGVIGRGQRGQCVHIPEKDLSVQSCRSHQLFVFSICQCFNIVLQKYHKIRKHNKLYKNRNTCNAHFNIEKHYKHLTGRFLLETFCIKLKTHCLSMFLKAFLVMHLVCLDVHVTLCHQAD